MKTPKLFRRKVRRSRSPSYRPLLEAFEERTLLSFITGTSFAAGSNPTSVVVGDFNRDGIPDLAVSNGGIPYGNQGTVNILLGKGDGTFQAPQSYAVGRSLSSVAVGDF